MNKSIIVAILGLIAGLLLIGLGFLLVRGDFTKFNGRNAASRYEKDEYRCSGKIDEIEIGERSENIEIRIGSVDKPVIEYWYREGEKDEIVITEKDGKLTFKREDKHSVKVVFFSMNFEDTSTVVTLPEDYNGPITATATSGRVMATGVTTGKDMTLKANSGYVVAENLKADNLTMKATSGSIKLNDTECAGRAEIENTSGYITVERLAAGGEVFLKNTSGYIRATDVSCGNISAQNSSGGMGLTKIACDELFARNTSGSIKLTNVSSKSIEAENTSGGIRLDGVSGDALKFASRSGSVNGNINGKESDYSVITSTTSGSCNLATSRDGEKTLDVSTTSGGIRISFDK